MKLAGPAGLAPRWRLGSGLRLEALSWTVLTVLPGGPAVLAAGRHQVVDAAGPREAGGPQHRLLLLCNMHPVSMAVRSAW